MKHALDPRRGVPTLVLLIVVLCGGGCDYFSLADSDSEKLGPSASAGASDNAPPAASDGPQVSSSGDSKAPEAPSATPEPTPVPQTEFAWIPGPDSVVVKIPAKYAHWKFWVFSRRKHATLYGPDYRGGNKAQEVVYTLDGGGAAWSKKSRDAGDDGTLLVIVNTKDIPPGAEYRNAAWRIMKPTSAQYGDGDRLMAGDGDR